MQGAGPGRAPGGSRAPVGAHDAADGILGHGGAGCAAALAAAAAAGHVSVLSDGSAHRAVQLPVLAGQHVAHARCAWHSVLSTSCTPTSAARAHATRVNTLRRLGPQLLALDRVNLTGRYCLDLTTSTHRAVARRLQLAALQDDATAECRCVRVAGVVTPACVQGMRAASTPCTAALLAGTMWRGATRASTACRCRTRRCAACRLTRCPAVAP
jgi:hypothetical protein